jgi:hypothetical protein
MARDGMRELVRRIDGWVLLVEAVWYPPMNSGGG